MKGQRMLTSDTILQGSWQNIKLDPELARLPKWQVMQSEARTALMHLSGQIEVDALPLDGSCLSKSFNRASDHMSMEVVLTSGIDAERVSNQSLYDNSCSLMPPCDSGGGGACIIFHL
jgi:hypothetical protein